MADTELAQKIAEAQKKMLGDLEASGGKIILLVKGEAQVKSSDPKVDIRKTA